MPMENVAVLRTSAIAVVLVVAVIVISYKIRFAKPPESSIALKIILV